jgi:hypothetical protein
MILKDAQMSASHEGGLITQNGYVDQAVLMYAGAPLMFGVRLQLRGALSVAPRLPQNDAEIAVTAGAWAS